MKPSSCMSVLVSVLLFVALDVVTVRAQDAGVAPPVTAMRAASPAVRKAAEAAITAQLAAFAKGDYQKAVQYQSAGLRQSFPDVGAFRQMMETTYPQFAHSKRAAFGAVEMNAGGAQVFVPVTITGQDGTTVKAAYLMVREGHTYRVAGVVGGARRPLPLAPDAASA